MNYKAGDIIIPNEDWPTGWIRGKTFGILLSRDPVSLCSSCKNETYQYAWLVGRYSIMENGLSDARQKEFLDEDLDRMQVTGNICNLFDFVLYVLISKLSKVRLL